MDTHPEPWLDWRSGDRDKLRALLAWPREGVLFDVEKNGFWHEGWGPRPADMAAAVATATHILARVPTMVPMQPLPSVERIDRNCQRAGTRREHRCEDPTSSRSWSPAESSGRCRSRTGRAEGLHGLPLSQCDVG